MQVKEKKRQQEEAKMEENTYGELQHHFCNYFSNKTFWKCLNEWVLIENKTLKKVLLQPYKTMQFERVSSTFPDKKKMQVYTQCKQITLICTFNTTNRCLNTYKYVQQKCWHPQFKKCFINITVYLFTCTLAFCIYRYTVCLQILNLRTHGLSM